MTSITPRHSPHPSIPKNTAGFSFQFDDVFNHNFAVRLSLSKPDSSEQTVFDKLRLTALLLFRNILLNQLNIQFLH